MADHDFVLSIMASQLDWPQTDRLDDHWSWRPEWSCDRACLWWYVTFEEHPELAAACREVRAALSALDCVDVIPPPWLHLSLWDVGFVDELDADRVEAVIDAVADSLSGHPPLDLTLGPVAALPQAVVVASGPLGRLRMLRHRIRHATAVALGEKERPEDGDFWPHVSLCYVNRPVDCREAMKVAGRMRTPAEVTAETLTLASVTRRDHHYQWSVRARVPLNGA